MKKSFTKGVAVLLTLAMCAALLPLAVTSAAGVDITASFTDPNFEAAVRELIGKTNDEPILDTDVAGITRLNVTELGIESLAGIKHFTALTSLNCASNQLTTLDVSHILH